MILKELRRGFAEDSGVLGGVLVVWLVVVLLLHSKGVPAEGFGSYFSNALLYFFTLFFILLPGAAIRIYRERPDRPIRHLRDRMIDAASSTAIWRGIPILVALIVFMPAFSAMKSAIPLFNAYTWDATWIAADRAIFGTDAWRFLQPVLGHPLITALLAFFYHVWVMLIYAGGIYFAMFATNRTLRRQYFIAYFGIWTIIGCVMAIAFASVGPCFVGPILGDWTFSDQMAYLNSANQHYPIMVLHVQQDLLEWYKSDNHGLGRGITAMPSMHIAQAFTFFLAMRRISSKLGVASGLFCAIIYVASIHLAYHYAMDGIVSAAAALVIWKVAGLLAKGWAPKEPAPAPAEYA